MTTTDRPIITIASVSGGTGKTTTAAHISWVLVSGGRTVAGIDMEPGHGWARTVAGAADVPYTVVAATPDTLSATIQASTADAIVIDTPAYDVPTMTAAASVSTHVIVTITAGDPDVAKLPDTLRPLAAVEAARGQAITSILLNRADLRTRRASAVIAQYAASDRYPLIDTVIPRRVAYESLRVRRTPSELSPYAAVVAELEL